MDLEAAYPWRDLQGVEGLRAVLLRGEGGVFSAGGPFALRGDAGLSQGPDAGL